MTLAKFTLYAGWHDRRWCPAQTELKLDEAVEPELLSLWDQTTGATIPVQAWPTDQGKIALSWIVNNLAAQEERSYELRLAEQVAGPAEGVQLIEQGGGKLEIRLGGIPFTTYNYGPDVIRPYLYPVYSSDGNGLTRDWPMVADAPGDTTDHIHHRGIWTAHGEVDNGGGLVNNWGEGDGHGWQLHREFSRQFSGPIAGGFTQSLDWTDANKQTNMTETRRMTFYNISGPVRLFDYVVTLHASAGAVTLLDTKEAGLLSVRLATSMDAKNQTGGQIENGYGAIQEAETWGKRAPWCDYSGPINDTVHGMALMDHPDNPRYPTHWHVRDYGLMTANCFGLHDFTRQPANRWDLVIPAHESLTWRYRVFIHPGNTRQAQVANHYHAYINPPAVELVA